MLVRPAWPAGRIAALGATPGSTTGCSVPLRSPSPSLFLSASSVRCRRRRDDTRRGEASPPAGARAPQGERFARRYAQVAGAPARKKRDEPGTWFGRLDWMQYASVRAAGSRPRGGQPDRRHPARGRGVHDVAGHPRRSIGPRGDLPLADPPGLAIRSATKISTVVQRYVHSSRVRCHRRAQTVHYARQEPVAHHLRKALQ